MKQEKHAKDLLFYGLILILLLVLLYSGLQILESTVLYQDTTGADSYVSKTIVRNGVEYFPRQDITVVMVLGIDRFGQVEDSGSYRNRGASDLNLLLIFDERDGVCDVLQLNRDTMTKIPMLGLGGKPAGSYYGQLALAHTYGSGLEDSCENVRSAISQMLYGLEIDYYVALNMDAITVLNDAVGGVTVNVTEDFSKVDPTIGMGTVKLMGQQALNYVRTRKDVGDQLNITRMARHRAYMEGFLTALREKTEAEPEFLVSAYSAVEPYLVTDCSLNALSGMLERFSGYEVRELVTLEGENILGDTYFEFHLDEEKLDALVLRLFYAPKA